MTGPLLKSARLTHYHAMGAVGNPVYLAAAQLRAAIARRLGAEVADIFAVPQRNEDGDAVDWYAPRPGTVVPWSAATEAERAAAQERLLAVREQIETLGRSMEAEGSPERQVFGRLLAQVMHFPDEQDVHLVDGRPVLTFWGFVRDRAAVGSDPLRNLDAHIAADPIAAPRRRPWWLWLLLLVALLLLAGLLWALRGCDQSEPGAQTPATSAPALDERRLIGADPGDGPTEDGVFDFGDQTLPPEAQDQGEDRATDAAAEDERATRIDPARRERIIEGADDLVLDGDDRLAPDAADADIVDAEGSDATDLMDADIVVDGTDDAEALDTDMADAVDTDPIDPEAVDDAIFDVDAVDPTDADVVDAERADADATDAEAEAADAVDSAADAVDSAADAADSAADAGAEDPGGDGAADPTAQGSADDAAEATPPEDAGRSSAAEAAAAQPRPAAAAGDAAAGPAPVRIPPRQLLNSGWRTSTSLQDPQDGSPVQLSYSLRDGAGKVRLKRGDGSVCESDVSAKAGPDGRLLVDSKRDIVCADGSSFGRPRIECTPQQGGKASCVGRYPDGTSFPIDMERQLPAVPK